MMTHVVARIFASLFSQGFGVSTEDNVDDTGHEQRQDGKGPGMGDGDGVKDVSDQIDDEDQLIGIEKVRCETSSVGVHINLSCPFFLFDIYIVLL